MSGRLLTVSKGANRKYTFYPAQLAKAFPQIFDRVDNLGIDVAEHDDQIDELFQSVRTIAAQTGQNTRDIAKLRRARDVAA